MVIVDTYRYLHLPSAMQVNPHALRVIRERSGLSVTQLARLAGLSQPHLSNIETGRRQASPATVRRLADVLHVPVLALIADPGSLENSREVDPADAARSDDRVDG